MVTRCGSGGPFHLVFFDLSTGIWHGEPTGPICPGHDLDLGQHVLQAGRADGTATDGSPTFWGNGNGTKVLGLEILPDLYLF